MIGDKERITEWLTRAADEINSLRRKDTLPVDEHLQTIRQNYNIIQVLTLVAQGKAFMRGIAPLNSLVQQL
jgi:hypothetical protein